MNNEALPVPVQSATVNHPAGFVTLADAAPVLIWIAGLDKRRTFFNPPWLDFTGRTLEQELGNGWVAGVHPGDADACVRDYTASFDARLPFQLRYRLRRHDGEYRSVVDRGGPRHDEEGTFVGYVGSCVDITERARSEDAAEQQRALLRQVIDVDPNFIFAKDIEGRFTLVNQALADAYGTSVDAMIGKTISEFNPNRDEVEHFRRTDLDVINTLRERFIPEERLTDAAGKVHYLQTVKRPLIEKDGLLHQIVGSSTDITGRREAELELQRQREHLAHVARVATVGGLAASIAHELNQPLTAIMANAQVARRCLAADTSDPAEVHAILQDIINDSRRAADVIQRTRLLVRRETTGFELLHLDDVIREVERLVHTDAVLHHARVALDLEPALPQVRGDRTQLQQVLLNLLVNAFQSMEHHPWSERRVLLRAARGDDGTVTVACIDSGTGLSLETLGTLFQPFYTTKPNGIGLGLSVSQSIVAAHGGRLWAHNNPDRGASFLFTLPAIAATR